MSKKHSIYTRDIPGLFPIEENKDKKPEDIAIRLRHQPYVDVIPYGPNAGEYALWIQTTFSPIGSFPYEDPGSIEDDPNGLTLTVKEIEDIFKNKATTTAYIVGGDPLYKWDDELRYLANSLACEQARVIVETCGVTFPETFKINCYEEDAPHHIVVKPQLFAPVPNHELTSYFGWLSETVKELRWFEAFTTTIHFDMDCAKSDRGLREDIAHIIQFLHRTFGDSQETLDGLSVTFTPKVIDTLQDEKVLHTEHWKRLKMNVGKYIAHLPGAHVMTQLNHKLMG